MSPCSISAHLAFQSSAKKNIAHQVACVTECCEEVDPEVGLSLAVPSTEADKHAHLNAICAGHLVAIARIFN